MNREKYRTSRKDWDLQERIAMINGKEYPLFYAKIINKLLDGEQPFILFLGKPGKGKTLSAVKMAYDLTEKIGFFKGNFTAENNIFYENKEYMKAVKDNKNKIIHKVDINTTLHVSNYHKDVNRKFENMVNLCRIKGNFLTSDGQYLWQMDSGIQDTHTFRAVPGKEKYSWKIYYIKREPDSEKKQFKKKVIQTWKPDLPPERLVNYVKKKDKETKEERLESDIKDLKDENDLTVV